MMNKSNWGRKGLIHLTISHHSPSAKGIRVETQSRNMKGGMMEELCLLAFSPWLLNLLSYITQNNLFIGGSTYSGLGHPALIINKKNATGLPIGQSYGVIFSIKIPTSQIYLFIYQVHKSQHRLHVRHCLSNINYFVSQWWLHSVAFLIQS